MFVKPIEFKAEVKSIVNLAPNIFEYKFKVLDLDFEYKAGQFVMMVFDSLIDDSKNVSRAYSISSKPNSKEFELCVEIIEGGQAGTYFSTLKEGQIVTFKGPFGMCYLKPENQNDLIMIATGTGIAPIKSIVDDLIAKGDKRKIEILFGVRFEENIFYRELLDSYSEHENINARITLSKPSDKWNGLKGRVTSHLDEFNWENKDLYICGNGAMIREVRQFGLDQGLDKKQIHLEIFDS